jgi:hypothetical protein
VANIPTLFRYPGAEALMEALARRLPSLSPPGSDVIWLAEDPLGPAGPAPRRFGSLAVLDPARLSPIPQGGGVWVAKAQPVDDEVVIWIPPSRIAEGGRPWQGVTTATQARALLGPGYDDERAEVLHAICAYLEGLDEGP